MNRRFPGSKQFDLVDLAEAPDGDWSQKKIKRKVTSRDGLYTFGSPPAWLFHHARKQCSPPGRERPVRADHGELRMKPDNDQEG